MPIPKEPGKIDRLSAKERIYQTLRDWIIEGVLTPNERLVDSDLCEYFSVSRTPVREAFQLLEAQRLIEIQPGKATIVTDIDLNNLRECYLPMASIQGLVAALACDNASERDIHELSRLNRVFADAVRSGQTKSMLEADTAFHNRVIAMAGNQYLTDFSGTLSLHIQRMEYSYFHWTAATSQSVETHQALIEAISRNEPKSAEMLMKSNWLQTMAEVEKRLMADQAPVEHLPTWP